MSSPLSCHENALLVFKPFVVYFPSVIDSVLGKGIFPGLEKESRHFYIFDEVDTGILLFPSFVGFVPNTVSKLIQLKQ